MMVAQALAAAGFDILEAAHADDAIAWLERRQDVAVVFTDIKMPGSMDGLRLAAAIRDRWPPVKVVTTSQFVQLGESKIPEGALFVPKPYSPAQIVGTLHGLTGAQTSSA
jgi:CheY-like chemotaxis protein